MRAETGAGSVLGISLVASVGCLTALLIPLYGALVVKQSVAAAADAAALAAADVRVGIVAGNPCETAGLVARANGAAIVACDLDGLVATVSVARVILGVSVTATATAGPPPEGLD